MTTNRAAVVAVAAGIALGGLLAGCAGTELVAEARGIRGVVKTARDQGAYRCAPGELALAEAHVEFAEQELSSGDYFRARDHLGIADWNAREAMRLATDPSCQARRRPVTPAASRPDPDNDRDGVPDGQDRCPTEPEDKDGQNDADGCPDGDDDGDGVPDATDKCPKDREDKDGFEDNDGCGDPDNDKDGVLDGEDKCPNEAGLRLAQGCPQPYALITVTAEKIEIKQTIFFQSAKAVILAKSYPLLDEVAAAIKSRPNMKVRVEGHTDSRGNRQTNLRLSQARADAVKAYLVGAGVDAGRLESKGFGPDQPIETNRTTAGRERNRRVEFVITSQ